MGCSIMYIFTYNTNEFTGTVMCINQKSLYSHFLVIAFLAAMLRIPNRYFALKLTVSELISPKRSLFQLNCIPVPNIATSSTCIFYQNEDIFGQAQNRW